MTMFKIAIATVALAGLASADTKPDAKADPKAKTEAKADAKPAAKPEAPKPPAEVDAMAKTVSGSWKCKGEMFDMAGAKTAITATNTTKLDLDKFWLTDNLVVKGGGGFKMNAWTTYDAKASKWRRVAVDNWGSYMVGTSDGMKDNKMDWTMDTVGAMGTGQFRDHVDASDAKKGVKFSGEMSMDKGKTWVKVYEMTCTK